MFTTSFIKKYKKKVILGLIKRNFSKLNIIDYLLKLEKEKFNKIVIKKYFIAKLKKISFSIRYTINNSLLLKKATRYKKKMKILDAILSVLSKKIFNLLIQIPNLLYKKVPLTKDILLYQNLKLAYKNKLLTHWELGKKFHLFNFASHISGSGFNIYIDKGAKLQRSLIQYCLDKNIHAGYMEYVLPFLVNKNSIFGTGQFPDKKKQMYFLEKDKLYLIPTAEIPLINVFRRSLFNINDLPCKATSFTSCFRREAGSYGLKVKGLNRLHQFDKVEIIEITSDTDSYKSFNHMVRHVKNLLSSFKIPFRIINISSKYLGVTSALTYDFEVFSPGQNKWLEVSSVSNCTNFQSHRMGIKFINNDGKKYFCHTLNGSSLAIPRLFAALIENYQFSEYIQIPKVLINYFLDNKILL
ncbi:serine--tRNA ligase [Candidatus Karelsulcia muelleri]|uniref:Serine--tRNA ligase n=1 Tax=Candidatus Karelsulcia muelleri TaxID=336810 RepID=A0A346E147_9FLAO|nr:serine--tRNA ligase [Candidatus Karelsulcia muelleri]AXN02702.1 Seryl-tRNA synthetase [Candidatus Karelsulcia muelleri]WDI79494.1 serine--tRNA ligase [Candidatus Karelsulcia muelleri]WDR78952.1 serine--tRNA ligase [Candidatus Karelsulcia muelleri]